MTTPGIGNQPKSKEDKDKELEAKYGKMSHSELLQARLNAKAPSEQDEIAPFEHRAFAREYVEENPVSGSLAMAVAIPGYQAAKAVGAVGSRTSSSVEQMKQGFKGVAEGIGKAVEPWKMHWQRLTGTEGQRAGVEPLQQVPVPVRAPRKPWELDTKLLATYTLPSTNKTNTSDSSVSSVSSFIKKLENVESGGVATAKNPKSSATGLHQFTADTWMDEVNRLGLSYTLADRNDPEKSRKVVESFTRRNIARAKEDLGREPTQAELYMYHFLGDAKKFLSAPKDTPAVEFVSAKVRNANREVFYKDGKSLTVGELLNKFRKRFE